MKASDSKNVLLDRVRQELEKCAKCGECCGVCPVYRETGEEKFAARGKLALAEAVLNRDLQKTDTYFDVLNNCILCLSCVENCGSGVRVDKIVTSARADLNIDRGVPFFKQLLFGVLQASRGVGDFMFQSGSAMQRLLFKRIPDSSGLKRRFPLPLIDKDRYVPHFARHSFRNTSPDFFPAAQCQTRVLFFTGCASNYIFTGIAEKTVGVLNALGVDVCVPKTQACCGAPVEASGDLQTALVLARRNIEALTAGDSDDDIVTVCSSGGYMLKKKYGELLADDPQWSAKAVNVARRTYDISEYLIKKIGPEVISAHLERQYPKTVTYHDPCHLRKGQGIYKEPRELLKLITGDRYIEMMAPEICCGSGGLYGVTHADASLKILARKTETILATGASAVATGCPGCMIQLTDGIQREDRAVKVLHTMELLSFCLKNKQS